MVRLVWSRPAAAAVALVLLGMVGWIMLLVALAALTGSCHDIGGAVGNEAAAVSTKDDFLAIHAEAGFIPYQRCSRLYQFSFWTLAYEFIALHAPFVMVASPRFRVGAVALIAVGVMMAMEQAHSFLALAHKLNSAEFGHHTVPRARVAFAGLLFIAIMEFALLILLGWDFNCWVDAFSASAKAAKDSAEGRGKAYDPESWASLVDHENMKRRNTRRTSTGGEDSSGMYMQDTSRAEQQGDEDRGSPKTSEMFETAIPVSQAV